MKHMACLAALAALAANSAALALGDVADVTIIDRESGAALSTYYARGQYWVAGAPGKRYAIEIRNDTGARLLAVTSVDGVNVLSGATAGWDQAGYVFEPGERYQITGWRKSNAEVAAFTFTDWRDSYAARTGRPANVGVIGVALFRERAAPRVSVAPPDNPAALSADRAATAAASPPQGLSGGPAMQAPPPASRLGTGHGEREYSYVVDTEFRRAQREPNEVIRVRYDSLENLVAMGIVPPGGETPVPNPFPHERARKYVPDPPG
jgi:hypothetical protein